MKRTLKVAVFVFIFALITGIVEVAGISAASKKTPAKPKISVKVTDDNVKVTIKKTKNAEGYEIYIKDPDASDYKKSATVEKNGKAKRTYTISGLSEGAYKIKVRAYNGTIYSKYSSAKKAVVRSVYDFSDVEQGDIISFGRYEQDNVSKNGKENIEWVVLSKSKKGLLLMSRYILDVKPFHSVDEGTVWEKSTLRSWLNKDFYGTAFNDTEKSMIKKQTLSNKENDSKSLGGKNTKDKVFLLSVEDTNNTAYGFNDESEYYDITARSAATKYALSKGLIALSSSENINYGTADGEPSSIWWLRDPGLTGIRGTGIDGQGEYLTNIPYVSTEVGVRPVIFISLKS